MASKSHDALFSSKASVDLASPRQSADRYLCFCSPLPAWSSRLPARSTVLVNGPGTTARPISSNTAHISTMPRPAPSYFSGKMMPVQPWAANLDHSAWSKAVSVSINRRTSGMGHSAARNCRAEFLTACCVSVSPKCMRSSFAEHSLITLWQPEYVLPDDIPLNLRCSCFNGVAARPQVRIRPRAVIDGQIAAAGELRVWPQNLLRRGLKALVRLAPTDLQDGPFGTGCPGLHDFAHGSHLVQPQNLVF